MGQILVHVPGVGNDSLLAQLSKNNRACMPHDLGPRYVCMFRGYAVFTCQLLATTTSSDKVDGIGSLRIDPPQKVHPRKSTP